ncbi:TRIC cation channel family protein [Halorarum halophilum]|uniref:TRIC cation channel family protein n=1 Tax=Halorarum halophilum TaxID=2743090 RepID=A0A7D5GBN0_9EURY|nr:TRIC cation channel family protein [Halobaculum halophilum]QLG27646.1 TRIC cation channel family protein [Halobaculum halophilum]
MTQEIVDALFGDPFAVMNTIGLVAFALVGATKAIREEFDMFGVTVVGLATAFAGGMTRDLLVDRIPLALSSPIEIGLGVLGVGLAIGVSATLESADTHPLTLLSDAIGLAAFTTAGAIVATQADIPAFGIVAIATVNAVGGGAVADILLDRSPFILLVDFYASCAVLGGSTYWLVVTAGGSDGTAAALCAAVVIGTRTGALIYGWSVPSAQGLGLTRE